MALFAGLLVAFLAAIILAHPAHAAANNSVNTLKITPVRSDIQIRPGQSKVVKMTVTNLTESPIVVKPVQNDFIAGDEDGSPALILDADKFAPTHSLKRFMTPLADMKIPAKETRTLDVKISVPQNAQAGGYFGAVRFAPSTTGEGGQVNLNASVASIILLTVPGDLVEKLSVTNFDVQQGGKDGWLFADGKDIEVLARFENTGNVQVAPFGKISVKNGDKVVYETDFNAGSPKDMTLPDYARRWKIPLDKVDTFGNYTVSATITYGSKNYTLDLTKSFWVVPMSYIIAAVAALVVIVALIVVLAMRRGRRGKKLRLGRR